jgi:hypothetical protein
MALSHRHALPHYHAINEKAFFELIKCAPYKQNEKQIKKKYKQRFQVLMIISEYYSIAANSRRLSQIRSMTCRLVYRYL